MKAVGASRAGLDCLLFWIRSPALTVTLRQPARDQISALLTHQLRSTKIGIYRKVKLPIFFRCDVHFYRGSNITSTRPRFFFR